MARSIYQGSAAAVCQPRELSALDDSGSGSREKTASSILLFFPLSTPPSFGRRSPASFLPHPSPSLFYPPPSSSLSLKLRPSSRSLLLSRRPSFSSVFLPRPLFPLLPCFWVIFHRCSGRQKRRDGGGGASAYSCTATHTRTLHRVHLHRVVDARATTLLSRPPSLPPAGGTTGSHVQHAHTDEDLVDHTRLTRTPIHAHAYHGGGCTVHTVVGYRRGIRKFLARQKKYTIARFHGLSLGWLIVALQEVLGHRAANVFAEMCRNVWYRVRSTLKSFS